MNTSTFGNALKQILIVAFVLALTSSISFAQDDQRMFILKLPKGKQLVGQIVELGSLKMTTSFGEINIPISKIDGIRLHADKTDSAVVALVNGDIVTGKIPVDEIQLKTSWGKAVVNSAAIESMTSNRNARFYQDPSAGGWRFSRALTQPGLGR